MARRRGTVAFNVGLVVGGLAGAIYGLLNAPVAGAETRASLAAVWEDVLELAAEGVADVDRRLRSEVANDGPGNGAGNAAVPGGTIRD